MRSVIHPTEWGELESRLKGIIEPEFRHVHICDSRLEAQECFYDWTGHNVTSTTGECEACARMPGGYPRIDFSDVRSTDGQKQMVFIVHGGQC